MEDNWDDNDNDGNWSDVNENDDIEYDIPEEEKYLKFEDIEEKYQFGDNAFKIIVKEYIKIKSSENNINFIQPLFVKSIPNFMDLRGQRGQHTILYMIQTAYSTGLFTLSQSINKQIIPALRYILNKIDELKPDDPKRNTILKTLSDAFLDCQQVQAREILRIYGDLTNQTETLDKQIIYILMRQKEQSLNEFISQFHMDCDLDHTKSKPSEQRVHLYSAYLDIVGEQLGMDGIESARGDRFLGETLNIIRSGIWADVGNDTIYALVKNRLSLRQFIECILSDINCQSDNADRLINPSVIFKWVTDNMTTENARKIFYNEENIDEYKYQEPNIPKDKNKYNPFLSLRILVDILTKMNLIKRL